MQIIMWLRPKCYFIENPQSGMAKERLQMGGMPYVTVDYCMYASHHDSPPIKYRKRTALWTNCGEFPWRRLCRKDCGSCVNGKHLGDAQRASHSLDQLYRIPRELCDDMVRAATQCLDRP